MPFALVFIGLIMIVTGVNNTHGAFAAQLKSDFSGDKSFFGYVVAIGLVGALGYIKTLRTFSTYFMALILIALILSNRGFFQNFTKALNTTPVAPNAAATSGAVSQGETAGAAVGAVKDAATGNNPGSDAIGTATTWLTQKAKGFFGF